MAEKAVVKAQVVKEPEVEMVPKKDCLDPSDYRVKDAEDFRKEVEKEVVKRLALALAGLQLKQ